jgi:hypothetical protein
LLQFPQITFVTSLLKPRTFCALLQEGDTEYGDLMYNKQVVAQRCVNTSGEVLPFVEDAKIIFFMQTL